MSTLAVKGPNRPLHLRSKSSSRTNRSNDSQSERDIKVSRITNRKASSDAKDDAATIAFVRRTLCAGQLKPGTDTQSLEDLLPPLTSSNEIDLQLYAIISVIIKDFVQAWYAKITPDHEFVDEVIQIIAHCTRGLEQRLRRIDLESLLLDEIPGLLNQHAEAFRTAQAAARSDVGRLLGSDFRTVYHSTNPHLALSPVPPPGATSEASATQCANEAVWRQLLIEGVLDHLLPPEDLQNPCLKVLVSEIFSEMIVGNVLGGKVCQGWFVWDVTTKAILATRSNPPTEDVKIKKSSRLDQYGLLSSQNVPARETTRSRTRVNSVYALIINVGWEILRIALLIIGTVRTLFVTFSDAAQLPSRSTAAGGMARGGDASVASSPTVGAEGNVAQIPATKQNKAAVLDMAVWCVPVHMLGLAAKMPWLVGAVSLFQHHALHGPGKVGATDARLDRLLSHHINTILTDPTRLPPLLKTLRTTLFPNNSLAPGVPPPSTPEEIQTIKSRCADTILSLIPEAVKGVYFGSPPSSDQEEQKIWRREALEREVLELFADEYANKHFLFALLEVVVCRLFPELSA
ncbi:hypothetical protein K461DRAFT_273078 [Myriangium duriaei CBS 260.36]|uniref:PXA domain-containing protein n=1 Tax=Myriangium duriaei CBS 260.36 TaxID=1168546 RepID=A0A9P4J7W0_9PEZI|nr:hypothetical protein K461DRAFT_273078 [Myriangium duriaei CBS 260.36]